MNTPPSSGPSQPASRATSLGAAALSPSLHRESDRSSGGRLRRSGCHGCGNGCCGKGAPDAPPPRRASAITGWLADRPWLFVTGAFALLIGVWATFLTLALKNPVRDVLKNPLPATADVRTGH